jgi:hypothetical protein
MADRPIIFSAPMIRALIEGRKTQTRRLAHRNATAQSLWHRIRPGDRLWVRETFVGYWTAEDANPKMTKLLGEDSWIGYSADNEFASWPYRKPAIHMPRSASRITLTVTEVRRQRLQEISEDDAIAEGVCHWIAEQEGYRSAEAAFARVIYGSCTKAFSHLWETIHGADSWETDPEVIALTFTVSARNIDGEDD